MNNIITINSHDLQIKEYKGQRVVTFKDIDECHERPEGTARKRFNDNKSHFVENIDYFTVKLTTSEIRTQFGAGKNAGKTINVITETGYMMLVKSFTDDLAWQVQRLLVNTYFSKKTAKNDVPKLKEKEIEVKHMNAKARVASIWLKLADRVPYNEEYQQICNCYASEVLTGEKVLPLPENNEHYYTATEIATIIGSNANTVGKKAKAAGIRPQNENEPSENGKWFFDKASHSNKELSTFKYNDKGLCLIKDLFRVE